MKDYALFANKITRNVIDSSAEMSLHLGQLGSCAPACDARPSKDIDIGGI